MKCVLVVAALSLLSFTACDEKKSTPLIAVPTSPAVLPFSWKELKPGPTGLSAQLRAEAQEAASLKRRPVLLLHAEWCAPCKAIDATYSKPPMSDAFAGLHIVRLDIDQWPEQHLEDARIDADAVPTFIVLDANGAVTDKRIGGSAWGEDIPENMAPPLKKFFAGL